VLKRGHKSPLIGREAGKLLTQLKRGIDSRNDLGSLPIYLICLAEPVHDV